MSLYTEQALGGYANDEGCPGCGQPMVRSLRSRCAACTGDAPEPRVPRVPPAELVERQRLLLAGRKLKAYRKLMVDAITRVVIYTQRLQDVHAEAAAGTASLHAVVAAHNAFILRPDLMPEAERARVAA